jgi:hypothetical protein
VLISTSASSTENVLQILDLIGVAYPNAGGAARHLGHIIAGTTTGGRPERDDAELVERIVDLGWARGGAVEDFRWALNKVCADEARAGRGTRRANRRRLLPKVEARLAQILGR